MTRPRIAMVLNAPGFGGVTEVVHQLLRGLPRGDFEPLLFFLKSGDETARDRNARIEQFASLGVEIGMASGREGKIGAIAELASWLGQKRIDLVHTHSYRPNLYGRMAASLVGRPGPRIVAHYHNNYDDKWRADATALLLERTLATSTDAMIAVSEEVREHVASSIGLHGRRIDVIRNGVDLARFMPGDSAAARAALGLDQAATIVGLVGRVCEQKGHEDLVEAAIMLAPARPHLHFAAFGDVEDRALHTRLVARIGPAGLGSRFTFLGHVGDVPKAFAAADIVAVPSRWEGYPLVVAEAMACGRPMVATAVSAIPEMTGHGEAALLVPPRDPAALALALRRLVDEATLGAAMSARGIALSAAMGWGNATDAVAAVYAGVLGSEERPRRCA